MAYRAAEPVVMGAKTIKPSEKASDIGEIEDQYTELLEIRSILREEISQYTKLTPWKSYVALGWQWLLIGTSVALALLSGHWLLWPVAMLFIAGRQHALGVLGHDASHYRLSNSRGVNEFLADFFCWLPLFFCHRNYAYEHIPHHRFVNTGRDPYLKDFVTYDIWEWPKTRKQAMVTFLRILCGLEAKAFIEPGRRMSVLGKTPALNRADKLRAGVFYGSLALILTICNAWLPFLILWVLPLISLGAALVHWRTVSEHLGLAGAADVTGTRHVNANFLERLTFAPLAVNYHLDHHLFPGVPFYNLPRLHQRLLTDPVYRRNAIIKDGYFGRNSVFSDVVIPRR